MVGVGWFGRTGCMTIGWGWVAFGNGNNQPVIGLWLENVIDAVKDCIKLSHCLT